MEQNEQIPSKQHTKSIPAFVGILIYILLFFFFSTILSIFFFPIQDVVEKKMDDISPIIMQFAVLCGALLAALLVLKKMDHRPLSDLGLSIRGRAKDVGYGFLVALFLFASGFGVSLMCGVVEVAGVNLNVGNLAISFVFFILVALSEEIAMRGYVLGRLLRTGMNRFVSLVISSLLFALMHLFNPNVAFLPMLNLVLAGLLLGASVLYTRNLWFSISLHLFWNWIQGPVLGYEVSGNKLSSSLISLNVSSSDFLSGGEFGFEGSFICTVLLVLMTGGIILYFERHCSTPAMES